MNTVDVTDPSPKTHDDSVQDAASAATKTTADTAAGQGSRIGTTAASQNDSAASISTSYGGAGHKDADNAKAGSESSGGSQH